MLHTSIRSRSLVTAPQTLHISWQLRAGLEHVKYALSSLLGVLNGTLSTCAVHTKSLLSICVLQGMIINDQLTIWITLIVESDFNNNYYHCKICSHVIYKYFQSTRTNVALIKIIITLIVIDVRLINYH